VKRPQHWTQECPACEGAGVTQDIDYDDGDKRLVVVRCEYCDGSGRLTSCDECDEVMSLPEAETTGYRCTACVVRHEIGDASAEAARLRRTG
jgi:DnaJ-class molecular chaperone